MSRKIASIKCEYLAIYSPFTGVEVDGEEGVNEKESSVLFVYYGNAGLYGHISARVLNNMDEESREKVEELSPEDLIEKINISGAFLLEIDAGWNGVNFYAFAPLEV